MKRIKSIISFILITIILLPVYINASGSFKYEDAVIYAENYIKKGNFKTTHDKYIKKTNIPHFIEKNEYEKTIGANNRSYLFDGVEFWTSTGNDSKHFIVNHKGETKEANNNSKYNIKDTEYVNENVKVRGSGTYHNPWTFDPMYEVTVKTDEKYGHIIDENGFVSTKTVFASRGEEVIMQVEKKEGSGYKYITNSCGATYSNGYLKISNVNRNISCNVIFGTGRFKVTLNGATPDKIVSSFKDNFYLYNDSLNSRTIITKITPPKRTGYIFKGYKYNDVVVVNPDGSLNRAATNSIYEDIELNPSYDISAPIKVAISGSSTKIYNSSNTTLTCSTTSTYDDNTRLLYSFGFSNKEGDTPSATSWTKPGTSNKYEINKSLFFGAKYYSCRIYAEDSTTLEKSFTSTSPVSSSALVKYINAKITFDENGGTISGPSTRFTRYGKTDLFSRETIVDTATDSLPSASKKGHKFMGWYNKTSRGDQVLKADCSLSGKAVSEITDTSKYILTENKTLYAHYTPNEYTITYKANGGSGEPSPTTYTYATSGTTNLSSKKPTRSGYTFLGWALTSTATAKQYDAGQAWALSNASNYTLYAVWKDSCSLTNYTGCKKVELCYNGKDQITAIYSTNNKKTWLQGSVKAAGSNASKAIYIIGYDTVSGVSNKMAHVVVELPAFCTGLKAFYKTAGVSYKSLNGCNYSDIDSNMGYSNGFKLLSTSKPIYEGWINSLCISENATSAWHTNCQKSGHADFCTSV